MYLAYIGQEELFIREVFLLTLMIPFAVHAALHGFERG